MKLVILDRDGTINDDRDDFIKSPERVGADARRARGDRAAEPRRLARGGRDQPVRHRARPVRHGVAQRHARDKMHTLLPAVGGRIDAVFFCPHTPDDGCDCRKPKPGLFEQIGERYGVDLDAACRWSATRCATCRPAPPPAASRTWCAPARARRARRDEQLRRDRAAGARHRGARRPGRVRRLPARSARTRRPRGPMRRCTECHGLPARAAALGCCSCCGWWSRWCRSGDRRAARRRSSSRGDAAVLDVRRLAAPGDLAARA